MPAPISTNWIAIFRHWIGTHLSKYLSHRVPAPGTAAATDLAKLLQCLQPGDVVLVEGQSRISAAIKYLTQSTWSHAALYVGQPVGGVDAQGLERCFVEADLQEGVRAVSAAAFQGLHCRICRPVGLSAAEVAAVTGFVTASLGHRYDLRNVLDLARYLFPTPPVPRRWRRRMLALGSGDPTRAICSTLIASAFQLVRYPILPQIESLPSTDPHCAGCIEQILHVRHHSLYVPRDFDVSPYFEVVKPTLACGFDFRLLRWNREEAAPALLVAVEEEAGKLAA
jgi:hypothetical protein